MIRNVFSALSTLIPLLLIVTAGCQRGTGIPTGEVQGIITLNGEPAEGVSLSFVPRAMVRPSMAQTDANGQYRARFVSTQSGVALGPCVVELSIYRGDSPRNYLPKQFNVNAEDNPDFNLEITEDGLVFNYDIVYAGEIPPP